VKPNPTLNGAAAGEPFPDLRGCARRGRLVWRCMRAAAVSTVLYLFLLLLYVQGLCQASEQVPVRQTSGDPGQLLAGSFERAVRGDSLFGDRTSNNGVPLFTQIPGGFH